MQPVWGHGLNTVSKTISTQFQVKDLKICANLGKETESLFSPVSRGEFKHLLFKGDFQSKLYFSFCRYFIIYFTSIIKR